MPEPIKQPPLTVQLRHVLHVVRKRLLRVDVDKVAADLGISRSNIYRLRRGEGVPSIPTLELLAYYFDTGCRLEQSPDPQTNGKGPAQPPAIHPAMQPATAQPASNQPARSPWE